MSMLDSIRGWFQRRPVPTTKPVGAPAVANWGGYLQSQEKHPSLRDAKRFEVYADAIANVPIVATAIRLRLDLGSKPDWTCEPPNGLDTDEAHEYARRGDCILGDMDTPLPKAVQRSMLFADYGYAIQTWHVRRNDEGWLTVGDLRPIACKTVERWDTDEYGRVLGVEQVSPQTQERVYIPRDRMVYLVDDALNDSPEGLGLLRQVVEAARRLGRLEQLETVGYDTDLSGVPKIRAPINEMSVLAEEASLAGKPEVAARMAEVKSRLTDWAQNHNRGANSALILDSEVYADATTGALSTTYKQDVEVMQNGSNNLAPLDVAIMRHIKMIALVYGVEGLLIGMESTGAYALAKDKTTKLHLLIDALLGVLRRAYQRDLLEKVWALNGWPIEFLPTIKVEPVNRADVAQVVQVMDALSRSGIVMAPDDPAIDQMRGSVDLPPQPEPDPAIEGLLTRLTRPDAEGEAAGTIDTEEAA